MRTMPSKANGVTHVPDHFGIHVTRVRARARVGSPKASDTCVTEVGR
jgi:hypothetical protein